MSDVQSREAKGQAAGVSPLLKTKSRGPTKQVRAALAFSKAHAYSPAGEYDGVGRARLALGGMGQGIRIHQLTTVTAKGWSVILPPAGLTLRAGPSADCESTVKALAVSASGSGTSVARPVLFTSSNLCPAGVIKACASRSALGTPRSVSTIVSPGWKESLISFRTQNRALGWLVVQSIMLTLGNCEGKPTSCDSPTTSICRRASCR